MTKAPAHDPARDESRSEHLADVASYYDATELDYILLWWGWNVGALHYGWWDNTTRTLRDALRRENQVLANRLSLRPGTRILDAGCGIGGSSVYLARDREAVVHGITVSKRQVRRATRRARRAGVAGRCRFSVQDYTKTRFRDGSFDVIWAVESVGHTENKDDFIKEAWRLLALRGRLIVADGWATSPEANAQEPMPSLMRGWGGTTLDTLDRFTASLESEGFVNIDARDETANIVKTIEHMNRLYFMWYLVNRLLVAIGLRNHAQDMNHSTAHWQYEAWQDDLLLYGVVYAEKPE